MLSNPPSAPGTPSHSAANNVSATAAITAHFDELKRELTSFSTDYNEWLENKRHLVIGKEVYLNTIKEEQGKSVISVTFTDRDHIGAQKTI